jgi:hypothetical protein
MTRSGLSLGLDTVDQAVGKLSANTRRGERAPRAAQAARSGRKSLEKD